MARYIDADKVIKVIKEANDMYPFLIDENEKYRVCDLIESQPDADVVAVVRCKDCKYNAFAQPNGTIHCHARKNLSCEYRNADDFCSYGERRE